MAAIAHCPQVHTDAAPAASGVLARAARSLRRAADAFAAPGRAQTDREIANSIRQSGGRLTDSLEREIERKLLAANWSLPG